MCIQTFVHHACGHEKLVDAPCALAADNPFFLKVKCQHYYIERTYSNSSCGVGEYYCGWAVEDGQFLDGLHMKGAQCEAAVNHAAQRMTALRKCIDRFNATADRCRVSREARRQHRAFTILSHAHQGLEEEGQQARGELRQVTKVIDEAKEWYRLNLLNKQMQAGPAVQPPFVPATGLGVRVPLELETRAHLQAPLQGIPMAAPPVYFTQQASTDVQNNKSMRQPSLLMPPSEGNSMQAGPMSRDRGNPELEAEKTVPAYTARKTLPPTSALARSGSVTNNYQGARTMSNNSADAPRRRDRTRKQPSAPAASVAPDNMDMTNVRRSTRVRKKKVMYAESQGSSPSRDSSPDKKFEPVEKSASEWSEPPSSPEKLQEKQSKLQRDSNGRFVKTSKRSSGESLASKIGDYQSRTGNADGGTSGKSVSKRGMQKTGGQVAMQQGGPSVSRGATNKVWYAEPSEHYQAMLKGGATSLAARRPGERGYASNGIKPWTADTTAGSLGRPFPDDNNASAVVTPNNTFSSYMQQSLPGVNQPSQTQRSWSVQPGAQYPMPQPEPTTSGQSSHSQPDFASDKMLSSFNVKTANGTKTYSLTADDLDKWLSRAKPERAKPAGVVKKSSKKQSDDMDGSRMSNEGYGRDESMTLRKEKPMPRSWISTMPGVGSQMGAESLGFGLDPDMFKLDSGSSAVTSFGSEFQMADGECGNGMTSGMQTPADSGNGGKMLQGGLQMLDSRSQGLTSRYPMPAELQKFGSGYPLRNGDDDKSAASGTRTSANGKAAGMTLEGGLQQLDKREKKVESGMQAPADSDAFSMTLADAIQKSNEGYRKEMPTFGMQTATDKSTAGLTIGGNFQMRTGAYDKGMMASGMQTPADSKADSVLHGSDANQLSDIDPAGSINYERMHRSFAASDDLSPAKTPDIFVTDTDTDPKKRAPPASSPTPSAKRMRLSLPGQDERVDWNRYGFDYSNDLAHGNATSSPAKMTVQRDQMTDSSFSTVDHTPRFHPPSSPAPIMAPDAIHFPQAQAEAVVENFEDAANLPSFGCGNDDGLQGGDGDLSEFVWEEIDWDRVEDGQAFGGGE